MPAERGQRTARTKRAGRDDDERDEETARSNEQDEQDERDEQEEQEGPTERGDVATAAQAGRRLIAAVTGKEPEGVTSVEPTDTGWVIEVEVLEDRHIPSSADVLALYEVEVDADGTLLSYRRTERYTRGRGGGAGGGGRS